MMWELFKNPYPDLDRLPEIPERNPVSVQVEPTTRCNTRCRHCLHYYHSFGEDMEEKVFQKVKNSLFKGAQEINFSGIGEPLIAKHFQQMMDECSQLNIPMRMATNGIALRDEQFLAKLVRTDIVVQYSIDGARKETFESIRPGVKWEQLLETLEAIKRNAAAAGPEKRFRLGINYVMMKRNIGDLPDLVRLAAKYQVENITLLPYIGEEILSRMPEEALNDSMELATQPILEAMRLAAQHKIDMPVPKMFSLSIANQRGRNSKVLKFFKLAWLYWKKHNFARLVQVVCHGFGPRAKTGTKYCLAPWTGTDITANGVVLPCCLGIGIVGDLRDSEWKEIWEGKLYRNLRRTIHSWNPTTACRYCDLSWGINGGNKHQYEHYFAQFSKETIPLNEEGVTFDGGFYQLELDNDGAPCHCWMGKQGRLTLPMRQGARFLRLEITHGWPTPDINPGRCLINGKTWEPFDNSCLQIVFPLNQVRGDRIELNFEMEDTHHVPPDPRELSIAVLGIEYLF